MGFFVPRSILPGARLVAPNPTQAASKGRIVHAWLTLRAREAREPFLVLCLRHHDLQCVVVSSRASRRVDSLVCGVCVYLCYISVSRFQTFSRCLDVGYF